MRVKLKSVIQPQRGAAATAVTPTIRRRRRRSASPRSGAGMPGHRCWPWRPSTSTRRSLPEPGPLRHLLPSSHHIGRRASSRPRHAIAAATTTGWPTSWPSANGRAGLRCGHAGAHDVAAAVDELARNVERGFKAAFISPGLVDSRRGTTRSTNRSGGRPSAWRAGLLPRGGLRNRISLRGAPRQDDALASLQPAARDHVRDDSMTSGVSSSGSRSSGSASSRAIVPGAIHALPAR